MGEVCERMKKCKYFNESLKDLEAIQKIWKDKYCKNNKLLCARYIVLNELGEDAVPTYLVPTQRDEAQKLIDEHKAQ